MALSRPRAGFDSPEGKHFFPDLTKPTNLSTRFLSRRQLEDDYRLQYKSGAVDIVGHKSDHTLAEASYSYFLSAEALPRTAHALPYRYLPRKRGTVARHPAVVITAASTRNEGGISIKSPMANDATDVDQCGRCTITVTVAYCLYCQLPAA
jgi:hypothetical protein